MSECELVYYIDPNNELWIHRGIVQKYIEEYLEGKARLATDKESESIICLTRYKIRTDNRFKFVKINHATLYNLMRSNTTKLKLDQYEIIDLFKMGLSKDIEARTLGINTLIKYEVSRNGYSSFGSPSSNYNFREFVTKSINWLVYHYGISGNSLHKVYELSLPVNEYLDSQLTIITSILKNGPVDKNEPIQKIKELIYERIRAGS